MKRALSFFLLLLVAIMLLVTIIFWLIYYQSRSYIYTEVALVPKVQTALILGASTLPNGDLSAVLKDRVDAGIVLYKAGKVEKILVSGDNGTTTYNEVNPVREYLLARNVKDVDIFLDHAGFDTYSSMYRARDIFLVDSIIIVTQSFHLPRSVYTARKLNLKAYGYSADNGNYLSRNYTREKLANVKAIWDIVTHAKPKYLGVTIPITN